MNGMFDSKAAQVGLIVAIFLVVTTGVAIGTDSWAPFASALVWLPAIYVAIYYRNAGRRTQGDS